jgi:HK97 gp10 family phage protein
MLKSRIPQIIVEIDVRIADVIDRGADAVVRDAKARVPRKTDTLYNAIHKDEQDDGTYVLGGNDDEAWYGHLVEYGTVRTAPQPFLVPSLEENRQDIVDDGQRALRRL